MENLEEVRKAKECINILLESHRELLSGDEIEALENTIAILNEYSESIESETLKNEIKSFAVEALAFITKIAIKVFNEE